MTVLFYLYYKIHTAICAPEVSPFSLALYLKATNLWVRCITVPLILVHAFKNFYI